MNKLAIIQKPELQIIRETKKIREFSDVERLTISKKITENLLNKLGVGNKSNEQHHIEVIKFIADDKEFTFEEYEKAFNLAILGVLNIDLLQQLNCIVVSKVMIEYRNYRQNNLKNYKLQLQISAGKIDTPTEEENKKLFLTVLKDEFQSYKETGKVNDMRNWLYDKLVDIGFTVDMSIKKILWRHSNEEIKKINDTLRKRDKYSLEDFKIKSEILYKSKLIEQIFKNYTTIEQLLNKMK